MTALPRQSDYYSDERSDPQMNPQQRNGPAPQEIYGAVDQLTPEEARVLAQCTNDALMNRSYPLMALSAAAVHFGIKKGVLTPHPALGSLPKIGLAMGAAYMVGRFSYMGECLRRLMELPNSPLAAKLRREKSGFPNEQYEHFESAAPAPTAPAYGGEFSPSFPSRTRPDDGFQVDDPDERTSDQGRKRSFEDLRRENRMQYAHNLYSRSPPPPPQSSGYGTSANAPPEPPPDPFLAQLGLSPSSDPFPPPAPANPEPGSYRRAAPESYKPVKKNAYGDNWEE